MVRKINQIRRAHGLAGLRPSFALFHSAKRYARRMMRTDYFGHPSRIPVASRFRSGRARRSSWHSGWRLSAARHRPAVDGIAAAPRRDLLSSSFALDRRRARPGRTTGACGRPCGSLTSAGRRRRGSGRASLRPVRGAPLTIALRVSALELGDPLAHRRASGAAARGGHRPQAAGAASWSARESRRPASRCSSAAHHRRRLARAEDAPPAARLEQGQRHRGHGHARARAASCRVGGASQDRRRRSSRRPRAGGPRAGRAALPGDTQSAVHAAFDALDETEKRRGLARSSAGQLGGLGRRSADRHAHGRLCAASALGHDRRPARCRPLST